MTSFECSYFGIFTFYWCMMSINLKGTSEVRVEYWQKRFFIKSKNNVMFLKNLSKIMFEKRRQYLSSYYIPSSVIRIKKLILAKSVWFFWTVLIKMHLINVHDQSKTSFALLIRIKMSKISILRLTLRSFFQNQSKFIFISNWIWLLHRNLRILKEVNFVSCYNYSA